MLNQRSIDAVNGSTFGERFRKPLYESYCFANIPGTIERLLVGESDLTQLPDDVLLSPTETYDNVVLFFVDAFGWRFWEHYHDRYPMLQRFLAAGNVSKITSQFPSTTAAHVTTVHTTQPVGESGVYEWFYYEPKLDAMIAPLPFSYAGDKESGSIKNADIDPKELYPNDTIYQLLDRSRVKTHLFQPAAFTPSPYSDVVTTGVHAVHPYESFEVALDTLRGVLVSAEQKQYCYFYYNSIDSIGHVYGPDSKEFDAAVHTFFTAMEDFVQETSEKCGKTLLLLTADHGQTHIDPTTTFYIDQELSEITQLLKTNAAGTPLVPAGSSRDFFLHVKDGHTTEVRDMLAKNLKGKAEVLLVSELIKQNFFGSIVSDTFLSRVGNVVILPYEGESVFWMGDGRFKSQFYGHHGGLTPHEMETIFCALEI